jgi:hypothetical protein
VQEEFRPPHTAEQVRHQLVLFITVKLLYGLFHLMQPASSQQLTLRSAPPPILKTDTFLDGTTRVVAYTDFGVLLGGCWGLSHHSALFMVPEHVVVYPSVNTRLGRDGNTDASSIDSTGAVVVLYGTHRARTAQQYGMRSYRDSCMEVGDSAEEEDSSSDDARVSRIEGCMCHLIVFVLVNTAYKINFICISLSYNTLKASSYGGQHLKRRYNKRARVLKIRATVSIGCCCSQRSGEVSTPSLTS